MAKSNRFFFDKSDQEAAKSAFDALRENHPELDGDDIKGGVYIKIGSGDEPGGNNTDSDEL